VTLVDGGVTADGQPFRWPRAGVPRVQRSAAALGCAREPRCAAGRECGGLQVGAVPCRRVRNARD